MAHTTRRSWHMFKPKLSGLSEHQPPRQVDTEGASLPRDPLVS